MTKKRTKEKYIKEYKKNENSYITVQFAYYDGARKLTYSKTFNPKDYPSYSACMREAIKHRDIKRAEMLTVGLPTKSMKTIRELLDDYFELFHVAIGTQNLYNSHYHKWVKDYDKPISTLSSLDIQRCLNDMIYRASDNIISRVSTLFKHTIKVALLNGYITADPMVKVIVPKSKKVVKKRSQDVNEEDVDKVIDYFLTTGKNEHDKFNNRIIAYTIIVMRETGMRPAEVYALSRNDVDLDRHMIHVRHSLRTTDKKEYTVGVTKTPQSVRDIPMTDMCEDTLAMLMDVLTTEYLFVDVCGHFMDTTMVSRHIRTVCDRMGVKFHLYTLRHRFATTMVESNVDIRTAMELMGHAGSAMTVEYARSDESKKTDAVKYIQSKSRKA